jgi:hypothetical protein
LCPEKKKKKKKKKAKKKKRLLIEVPCDPVIHLISALGLMQSIFTEICINGISQS